MITIPRARALDRMPGAAALALTVAGTALAITDGTLALLWVAAITATTVFLSRWAGWGLAFGAGAGGFLAAEWALSRLNALLNAELPVLEMVAWSALGLVLGVLAALRPAEPPTGRFWVLGIAAITGPVLLAVGAALAQVIPGALRLAWAMNGDFINAIVFARRMISDGGIDPTSTPQPTPLPYAMMAANMAGGRGGVSDGELLQHDVWRSVQVWIFVIGLACAVMGAIAAKAAARLHVAIGIPIVVAASCAGLTWYVIGVQFQFGFVNSAFAILLLLVAWLTYWSGWRRPLTAIAGLSAIAVALLTVWSPLVLCVVGLGVALLAARAGAFRARRWWQLLLAAVGPAVVLAYLVTVTLPGFFSESDALASDGGFPPIGPASIFVITAIAALLAILVGRRGGEPAYIATGALAFLGAYGAGVAYLVLQRWDLDNRWGYYPAKFAWTGSIVVLVIALALAAVLAERYPVRHPRDVAVGGAVGLVFVSLIWAPSVSLEPTAQLPIVAILRGDAFGADNTTADTVFALSGRQNGNDVLWRSAGDDRWPNAWLLQADLADADDPVRAYAHLTVPMSVEQVCEVIGLLGQDVTVHTADPGAEAELRSACAELEFAVALHER